MHVGCGCLQLCLSWDLIDGCENESLRCEMRTQKAVYIVFKECFCFRISIRRGGKGDIVDGSGTSAAFPWVSLTIDFLNGD